MNSLIDLNCESGGTKIISAVASVSCWLRWQTTGRGIRVFAFWGCHPKLMAWTGYQGGDWRVACSWPACTGWDCRWKWHLVCKHRESIFYGNFENLFFFRNWQVLCRKKVTRLSVWRRVGLCVRASKGERMANYGLIVITEKAAEPMAIKLTVWLYWLAWIEKKTLGIHVTKAQKTIIFTKLFIFSEIYFW